MKSDDYLPLVRWGAYSKYSGPITLGKHRYQIPEAPTFWDKVLATLTATEGGRYGAVNMYDRCILSVGLIQFCEAATIYGVTRMLGYCADEDYGLLASYLAEMPVECGFRRGGNGQWAFHLRGHQIASKAEQREIFLGGATGYKGQWTDEQIEDAKRVCAVMSCLWQEKAFRDAQARFTHERLLLFAMRKSRDILFPKNHYPTDGPPGALRAAFLSFAGNLPAVADKHFRIAYDTPDFQRGSYDTQLRVALKEMTFGPGIAIYPHRYDAIRPVLEREWGVDLPDFAVEMKDFKEMIPELEMFPEPVDIQRELINQGYDLGPAGADGDIGAKSRAAIFQFEVDHELPYPDGMCDAKFMAKLAKVAQKPVDPPKLPPKPEPPPEEPDDEPLEAEEERADPGPVVIDSERPVANTEKTSWTGAIVVAILAIAAAIAAALGL